MDGSREMPVSDGEGTVALIAHIYRRSGGDCSNSGISSRADKVIIVNVEGREIPDSEMPDVPRVQIVTRHFGERTVYHVEPVDHPEGMNGPMAGGALVYSSDSRFRDAIGGTYGALNLHDRFEEWR